MEISFIHSKIYVLYLGISCLKWYIFMFSSLDLVSEHPLRVSGRTVFTMTKNVVAPSSCELKVYA